MSQVLKVLAIGMLTAEMSTRAFAPDPGLFTAVLLTCHYTVNIGLIDYINYGSVPFRGQALGIVHSGSLECL